MLISIHLKLFHKIITEGTLSDLIYKAIVTLISKLHKDKTKQDNHRPTVNKNCGGMNKNGPNRPIGNGTIKKCGVVGVGVTLLHKMCRWG